MRHRYKHRFNRCKRRPQSSDTSDTDTSEDDDDDDDEEEEDDDDNCSSVKKRRKFDLLQKAMRRKQSKSKSDENSPRPRKRKLSESRRCDELASVPLMKRKSTKNVQHQPQDDTRRTKHRTVFGQKQPKFNVPLGPTASKVKNIKSEFAKRSQIESTSAGAFSVKQCCLE